MNNREIKVSVKDIPEVIKQLQQAEDKINNLQSKIDKAIEFIDGRIQILTVSVDNKTKDEYFNNKCIGGIQELKNVKEFLKEDK